MLNFHPIHRFVAVFAAVVSLSAAAIGQQNSQFTAKGAPVDDLPEVVCYPNPATAGNALTIKLADGEAEKFEAQDLSVKITDEHGLVLFSAELPDELEFTPPTARFPKGNYYLQYFQNGRLFQTEELRIE